MESQPPPPIDPRSHLDTLEQATTAARLETYRRSEWWGPFVAALVGPMFVAAFVLDGASRVLTFGGLSLVMIILAVWEARKVRVRRSFGLLPGRLGWIHFGFVFVLIISLQLGEKLVGRMPNDVLALVSYVVYLLYFLVWVEVFDRLIANGTPKSA